MGPFPALGIHSAGAVPIHPSIHAFCSLVPLFRSFPPSFFVLRVDLISSSTNSISSTIYRSRSRSRFRWRWRWQFCSSLFPFLDEGNGNGARGRVYEGRRGGRKGERNADNIHDF